MPRLNLFRLFQPCRYDARTQFALMSRCNGSDDLSSA